MTPLISSPLNSAQTEFNRLCSLGGGAGGGPARPKVMELLMHAGRERNAYATRKVADHFGELASANPWHVCFAIGLCLGHLAQFELEFTAAAASLLENWNDADLRVARAFPLERGSEVIERSLRGGHMLFEKVILPEALPNSLTGIDRAQQRWLGRILGPDRPPYIGSWNATAMFLVALLAQPDLAATQKEQPPTLPPSGPIVTGLHLLHRARLLSAPPDQAEMDEAAFEPGVIYTNNDRLAELCRGRADWSLIDVHSGVYMLGTRNTLSATWS